MQVFNQQHADQDQELLAFVNVLRNRCGNNFNVAIHNGHGNMLPSISIRNNTDERIHATIGLRQDRTIVGLQNMPATTNPNITNMDTVVAHVQNGLLDSVQELMGLMQPSAFYRWYRRRSNSINAVYAINYRNVINHPVFRNLHRLSVNNRPVKGG